ncbi:MAG: SDR family oxidoreductase [Erysipelotrichaceae bacterium]
MTKFDGKVIIVTGGGKGIGYGVSRAFAKVGANLVITGRTESSLLEAKEKLEKEFNIQVLCVPADGGDEAAVQNVIDKAVEKFKRIDAIVNNAQVSASGVLLADHTKADFDLAINSGLYATFFYMRAAFPYLKESKGSVINFASGAGLSGRLGQSSYAAAKEGIRGLSRVAANEWGEYGINVNIVCPLAMTPGLEKWKEAYPDLYEKTIKDIPLRHFGDPETEIGSVCVFLASDDAAYISGETISVQGGGSLRP